MGRAAVIGVCVLPCGCESAEQDLLYGPHRRKHEVVTFGEIEVVGWKCLTCGHRKVPLDFDVKVAVATE